MGKEQGGLAVPHSRAYYIASQIQLGGRGHRLFGHYTLGLSLPRSCTFGGGICPYGYKCTIYYSIENFVALCQTLGIQGFLSCTPIWRSSLYKELYKLDVFETWERLGVRYIQYISCIQVMLLNPSRTYRWNFLFQGDNSIDTCSWGMPLTRNLVNLGLFWHIIQLWEKHYCEQISVAWFRVYSIILSALQDTSALPCKRGWEKDVVDIDGDTWELCLSSEPLVSVLATQTFTSFFVT